MDGSFEAIEKDYPNKSDAEKYRLRQAWTLNRLHEDLMAKQRSRLK